MSKTKVCRKCGAELTGGTKFCPECGSKAGKPFYARVWFILLAAVVVIGLLAGGGKDDQPEQGSQAVSEETKQEKTAAAGTTEDTAKQETAQQNTDAEETAAAEETYAVKDRYEVGDTLLADDLKMVYAASGSYKEKNEFMQPKDGYRYIFLEFVCVNVGKSGNETVSEFDFSCYADGYDAEAYYGADDTLSATLAPGKYVKGRVYFEVPEDAEEIEVEYESSFWSDEKIVFLYGEDLDAGYVQEPDKSRTDGAVAVGDVVETDDFRISYVSCEEYDSGNMFIEPAKGCTFYAMKLEFENLDDSDHTVSSMYFTCYADGEVCRQTFNLDEDLEADLSAGRKASGLVIFQIPDDAEVAEAYYNDSLWFDSELVFTMR